jgi:replicative DNA helicase
MAKRPAAIAERTLPHNLEAERSVLGAILLHNDAYEKVAPVLEGAHFYRDAHRRIWDSIDRLLEWSGGVADLVTIKDDLMKRGELDEVGGPAYITALVDGVPRSTNVEHYAEIVREKAQLRGLIHLANKIVSRAYDAEDSAQTILQDADRAIIDLQVNRGAGSMAALSTSTTRLLDNLEYRVHHRGELSGVETGFKSINEVTGGWQAADYIVIGARPSIGKTTFILNSAVAGARTGARYGIFSMEMKRQQLEYRLMSILSGIPVTRLLNGVVLDGEWAKLSAATAEMGNLPIDVDDSSARTIGDIRAACRRMKADEGLDVAIIDYVQLMPGTLDRRGATRNEEITDISRRLKILAGEIGIAIILLSQLSRSGDGRSDPRPKLSDLRDSGALEQDADLVCFLHRRNHREGGVTNFIIEKQRNGPTGVVNLTLDRDTVTFSDGGEEVAPPEPTAEEKQAARVRAIIRNKRRAHAS